MFSRVLVLSELVVSGTHCKESSKTKIAENVLNDILVENVWKKLTNLTNDELGVIVGCKKTCLQFNSERNIQDFGKMGLKLLRNFKSTNDFYQTIENIS